MKVAILVAHGFTDSGVSIALDVLRTANSLARSAGRKEPFDARLVGATPRVRAASGMLVARAEPLARAARADLLLVPGHWVERPAEMDALLARADVQRLVRAIAAAHRRGATIGSACGGAFLLAQAGVLDGRTATTTWWLAPHLKRRFPAVHVEAARTLVVERRTLTAGAVFAQADLALHVVARTAGPTVARHVARLLLLDTHASQAAFMAVHQLASNDETVRRAESWIRARLGEPFEIADVARAVGTSPRTLARRLEAAVGASPIGFVQRLRVEHAVHLLETTSLSLEQVGERVGYADPNALRRVIRKHVAASPRELRDRGGTN
jgi:transcriptional regulator GlxA family with amidase domain